jgi:hypothetical protein
LTNNIRSLVMALVMVVCASGAAAQEAAGRVMQPVTLSELVLNDGSRMYGVVEKDDGTEIVFRTHAGATVTVRRSDVASVKTLSGILQAGEFLPPDPNATRLFFAPTGRSLKRGQVYLGVYEFVMPFVQVGVTDWLSVGGGTPLIFGIEDWDRPFWLTPKLRILDTGSTQLSVGVLHAFDSDGAGGGIAYGVVTRGSDVKSFTAGAGLAYANDGGRAGVVMLGGEARISRSVKAITENYIWKGGQGVVSGGVRFFGERVSADLALAVPIGADALYAFPVINFVYVF